MAYRSSPRRTLPLLLAGLAACAAPPPPEPPGDESRRWLAGDHHIHSRYSVGWDMTQDPPGPIVGGDAIYPIPMNALMARHFGLAWMAATDHGGPNHSKVSLDLAYPEIRLSRQVVPDVVQFFALELNPPGGDHSSLIVPHGEDEATHLHDLESRFDRLEVHPPDPARDTEERMLEALEYMDRMSPRPVVIAHHPARSAFAQGAWGLFRPGELRDWNDAAPLVAVGMEGSPGHQALALARDGRPTRGAARGGYEGYPTQGGFDQMTARLGGFWDALLGEGRRWWITANSDSHVHYTEGGADFWPGEYSKTYVFAEASYADILDGLRHGRVFVTTGDLVAQLFVTASGASGSAGIGGELEISPGEDVTVRIRFLDPDTANHHGDNPSVRRVDLIVGEVTGPNLDREADTNPTTRVERRFTAGDWQREGEFRVISHTLEDVRRPLYLRVRGTNGRETEPRIDPPGEDPWDDLWFYSNPVFITPR